MTGIIIIGHGPAGVSAALYTIRAGLNTMLIGKDQGALEKAERIENFYGHAQPLTGKELAASGIAQARRLGAEIITGEVVGLKLEEYFTVETTEAMYEAQGVIIATGASRVSVGNLGLEAFEGSGVSYCAVCDAFFYRGKPVAVLGSGSYALHETQELLPIVGSVTVLTNGVPPTVPFPPGVRVVTENITRLIDEPVTAGPFTGGGRKRLSAVAFEHMEEPLPVSGLFVAIGVAGSTALAQKIGAVTEAGRIVTDAQMRTSVPGLWAAGDCAGGLKQIAKAVYEGAAAGMDAVQYLRKGVE